MKTRGTPIFRKPPNEEVLVEREKPWIINSAVLIYLPRIKAKIWVLEQSKNSLKLDEDVII